MEPAAPWVSARSPHAAPSMAACRQQRRDALEPHGSSRPSTLHLGHLGCLKPAVAYHSTVLFAASPGRPWDPGLPPGALI